MKSELLRAKHVGDEICAYELQCNNRGRNFWPTQDSGIKEYQSTFHGLPHGNLEEVIAKKRELGQPAYVLDIMGAGQALRELSNISGGVALTATDLRSDDQKNIDRSQNISIIPGNIVQAGSWNEAKKYMHAQGISGFDIVVQRSMGGLTLAQLDTPKMLNLLLNRMWECVNPEGGTLLFQCITTNSKIEQKITSWIDRLKKEGFEAHQSTYPLVFEIIRSTLNEQRLPFIVSDFPQ